MAETYVRKLTGEGCAAVCESCNNLHPQQPYHSFLQSEIEEIIGNAIAYVRNGFTCFECGATLNSPLNIPFLGKEKYSFDDSPSISEVHQGDFNFSIPIDFDKDSDVAIARWLLLQPKHYFHVPAWESIKAIAAIYKVCLWFDEHLEGFEVEDEFHLLAKTRNKALDFHKEHHPELFKLITEHESRHQSIFEKVKEILNDEPTERN